MVKGTKGLNLKIGILAVMLLVTFILAYYPHFDYPYPLHADEWVRATYAVQLNHEGFERINTEPISYNEIGFVYFLNILSKFTDLLAVYRFLPALFACLSSLGLFFLLYYITKSYWQGIFSMLFFASIKSNINISGIWFFTPMTMALPFLFIYIISFIQGLQKKRAYLLFSALLLVLIAVIHPLSAMFLFLSSCIYLAFNYKMLRPWHAFFLIVPLILFFLLKIPFELAFFRFDYGWTKPEINYNLFLLYGILPLLLAVAGIYSLIKKKGDKFLLSCLIVAFSIYAFFKIFRFTYFIPYARIVFYLLVFLSPLSGIGLFFLLERIKCTKNLKKSLFYAIAILVILVVMINAFWGYNTFHNSKFYDFDGAAKQARLYKCVENKDLFLEEAFKCVYPQQVKYLEYLKQELPPEK